MAFTLLMSLLVGSLLGALTDWMSMGRSFGDSSLVRVLAGSSASW